MAAEKTIDQLLAEVDVLKKQVTTTESKIHSKPDSVGDNPAAYADSFNLSVIVVLFGVFICLCITLLILKKHQAENLLRPFGTILIVTGAIFLIVAGYSEQQISPVIGLLGTIAGYILGKESNGKKQLSINTDSSIKAESVD
jgi:ABC-type xylose transport system permease subunit